ncbi:MAG: VOC family protein [Candidatus Poribacteria bacterium]|nr:VOC family protein [Candidatus Poribacteria bacterium]
MQAKQILETCLYVDELVEAEAFYSSVLGLLPFSRVEGRHVFFRCGNGVFLLFNAAQTQQSTGAVPPHGANGPGHVAFAMQEDDIPNWREHLRQNGVTIEQEITWPSGGYSIYFRDSSGNSVELATLKTWGL